MVTHKDALGRAAYVLRQRGITSGQMEAAIRAYVEARGLVMVPKEPTEEMVSAARDDHEGAAYLPYSLYSAMIAAAPDAFKEASK